MVIPGPLAAAVEAWIEADPDPETRAELAALVESGDVDELADRFDGDLRFGTSGIRAPMGAGPKRMNRLVARRIAVGLVDHLDATERWRSGVVVVAHDARHGSRSFADEVVSIVQARGRRAVRFAEPVPTPLLVWAMGQLDADVGVMCTASHNPPSDNGMKVYLRPGLQPVPPEDEALAARIEVAPLTSPLSVSGPEPAVEAELVPRSVEDAYVEHRVAALGAGPRQLSVVYTPLHGVGWDLLRRSFIAAGFDEPTVVASQRDPDPAFPTTPYPNPEEPGALDEALALAARSGADVVLANDPDADRLAVAVPSGGGEGSARGWTVLSGNQLALVLADHLLRSGTGPDRLVVTAFDTTRGVRALCVDSGVLHRDVPTGFKWIVRPALEEGHRYIFGCEEALGYCVDPEVLDKDGIAAALVAAEILAELRAEGSSVWDRLEAIARRIGHHTTLTRYIRFDGPAAEERLAEVIAALRADPPEHLDGRRVEHVHDLLDGSLGVAVDAIEFLLEDGSRVLVRPSGTEPKCKVYTEVVSALDADAGAHGRWEASGTASATRLSEALLARITDADPDPH